MSIRLVIRQMSIFTNNHAYNGQYSKEYRKISRTDRSDPARHFDTSRTELTVPVCARRSVLYVQIQCPGCAIHITEGSFQRHCTCRECRSVTSTSTANITMSIDLSSFQQFFDDDPSQGHSLSFIQRSSLLALYSFGLRDDLVVQLTGCTKDTIHHWVAHYQQQHSLEDEPKCVNRK